MILYHKTYYYHTNVFSKTNKGGRLFDGAPYSLKPSGVASFKGAAVPTVLKTTQMVRLETKTDGSSTTLGDVNFKPLVVVVHRYSKTFDSDPAPREVSRNCPA